MSTPLSLQQAVQRLPQQGEQLMEQCSDSVGAAVLISVAAAAQLCGDQRLALKPAFEPANVLFAYPEYHVVYSALQPAAQAAHGTWGQGTMWQ